MLGRVLLRENTRVIFQDVNSKAKGKRLLVRPRLRWNNQVGNDHHTLKGYYIDVEDKHR